MLDIAVTFRAADAPCAASRQASRHVRAPGRTVVSVQDSKLRYLRFRVSPDVAALNVPFAIRLSCCQS